MSGGVSTVLVWTVTDTVSDNPMLQVRAVLTSAAGNLAASPVRLTVDRYAAGSATNTVGPGSVNLVTGDFRLADTDASAFGASVSRTASSRSPTSGQDGLAAVFGPQWQWSYASGAGGLNAAWLRRPTASTAEVITGAGTVIRFAQSAGGSAGWEPESGAERLGLGYDGATDRFTLTDTVSGGVLTFARVAPAASGYAVVSSATPAANSTVTYAHEAVVGADGVTRVRLRRIVAPTTAVASATCAADPTARGCRVLELGYATSTTATPSSFGDVAGQVATIQLWTTAPGALAATAGTVARYAYDDAGRLRETWDPRVSPALKTGYGYDAAGRVVTLTPPGELPWTFGYGTAGTLPTSGPGMLLSVRRSTLLPGSATQTNGTATTTVVYDVPTTTAQGGPYDLGGQQVSSWGQQTAPGTAVAVFPADAVPAGNVGTLGAATASIEDPTGLAITRSTSYDSQGRVTEVRMPASSGADSGTTVTSYYTATGPAPCGGRPEWTDLECRTGPKGLITDAGSNPDELVTKTTTYTALGAPATVSETANGTTRLTTIGYDAAGRETSRAVTGGTGTPVPATATEYDPASGQATVTSDASGARIVNEYDVLGRLIAYTDAAGARTTYQYDALDRKILATDAAGTSTAYSYDAGADPRGLLTSVNDSVAGGFTASYDANGAQVGQTLPGGLTQTTGVDPVGMPVSRTYQTSDGTPLFTEQVSATAQGQWLEHVGLTTQTYTVDALGRIVQVDDVADDVCTRRTYDYGATAGLDTNRAAKTTAVGAAGAGCPTSADTTETHSYDSADRIVDAGYGYDALGRTTAVPSGLTVGYFADDQVHQETADGLRQTWSSDPAQRPAFFTVEVDTGGGWETTATKVNHYRGDTDRPDYIVEDTSTGEITRNVPGVDGQLAATTSATGDTVLQLTNLHGDVNVVFDPAAATANVRGSDEFGVPTPGLATGRYGWLGGQQRSQEALGGTMLMGARVYDPSTGRFLQTDPVVGGNANPYDYCSGDPNGCADTSGRGGCLLWLWICGEVNNYSGNWMRAGEITTRHKNGSCRTWSVEPWHWGERKTYDCNTRLVAKHGGHLGGWGYDVDIFTFFGTHFYMWAMYQPAGRYVKFWTGLEVDCYYGNWLLAPRCS